MDNFHLPTSPKFTRDEFFGSSTSAGQNWQPWRKPIGLSMCQILCIGGGGGGGSGVVGANSTAAGGGGGGSGSQTVVTIPLALLPDVLYVSVGAAKTGAGIASYVAIRPATTANGVVAIANGGGVGGNASGATAGSAGTAGAIATNATMPLGWAFGLALAGQAGIIGGTTVAGGALTHPLTGLLVTGGTGGAGLPASGASGLAGGAITAIAAPSPFIGSLGGLGTASATTPPGRGQDGYSNFLNGQFYCVGATGGGSTHGSASGGGLVQASGGNGAIGCGGGGMGGALTGSSAGAISYGGSGYVLIICF